MPFLPILVIEILSALLISSLTPNTVSSIKHSLRHVLPLTFAQEGSSPPPDSSVAPSDVAPAVPSTLLDSQPPASSDQSGPTNGESAAVDSSPNPSDRVSSTSNPDQPQQTTTNNDSTLLNDINSQAQQEPTATPQTNQSSDQTSQTNDSSQSFSVASDEPAVSQASTTVLNSNDIVGGPAETVDTKTVEMVQKQDKEIAKATTPTEIAALSIDFAKDSVKEVEHSLRSDDFSTASFVAQRLSDHIDIALEQSQKVGSTKLSNQLKSFCRQADLLLRSQQLVVPEQGEQDFEIIRGKCLGITQ